MIVPKKNPRRHFLKEAGLDSNSALFKTPSPADAQRAFDILRNQVLKDEQGEATVTGQEALLNHLTGALIVRGHCLLEGPPGVNKTRVAELLALRSSLVFNWLQCTPDLMPSDIVWNTTLAPASSGGQFQVIDRPGKVFTNILVVDEINRASPKTHSALLQAMNVMKATPPTGRPLRLRPKEPFDEGALMRAVEKPFFGLPKLNPAASEGQCFIALCTQNPFEHEGVYPLARAQQDRILFKCLVDHPLLNKFKELSRHGFEIEGNEAVEDDPDEGEDTHEADLRRKEKQQDHIHTLYFLEAVRRKLLGPEALRRWREDNHVRPRVERLIYLSHLTREGSSARTTSNSRFQKVLQEQLDQWEKSDEDLRRLSMEAVALRQSQNYPDVQSGSGLRGYFAIIKGAFAHALLRKETAKMDDWDDLMPTEKDVTAVAHEALRHRIHLAPGARASGVEPDDIIANLLVKVGLK